MGRTPALVFVIVLALVGAGCGAGSGDDDAAGEISAFRIRVGDCLDGAMGESIETVKVVPCSEPHEVEVFHAFDLDEGDGSFPGAVSVQAQADDGCLAAFEGFVGADFESSQYSVGSFVPTAETWVEIDDREVLCLLASIDDGPLTGSARGTGS